MQAILYKTPTCQYCGGAEKLLKLRGFDVVIKDVASDLEARVEMIQKSKVMKVPVIDVDGHIFVGLDALEEKYGYK